MLKVKGYVILYTHRVTKYSPVVALRSLLTFTRLQFNFSLRNRQDRAADEFHPFVITVFAEYRGVFMIFDTSFLFI